MRPLPERDAARASGSAWVRALWGQPAELVNLPAVDGGAQRPVLSGRDDGDRLLHLPRPPQQGPGGAWLQAAGAHAAAHWRFGGGAQPRAGLKPVQLALFGVLEDARVEQLALRDLPGLRSLWLPFHAADAPQGAQFEALLARLARSLLDPLYRDPHPWVLRARSAFFGRDGVSLALATSSDTRRVASMLGNDIGQMRLPFNPRTYQVHAAYRDDNSHLWQEDCDLPPSEQPLAGGASSVEQPGGDESLVTAQEPVRCYPEWDHRIARYRAAWVQVFEGEPARAPTSERPDPALRRRISRALEPIGQERAIRPGGRAAWGDEFHPAALVEARVDQRLRRPLDDRVYRRVTAQRTRLAVLLLVDASASTAALAHGRPLLRHMLEAAQAAAGSLEALGHRSAVLAFRSRTRQRVDAIRLKGWGEPADAASVSGRHAAVTPEGSTRTGAAVRHATAAFDGLEDRFDWRRRVLLLTDGEPHDVDVHEADYLPRDLARAVAEASALGVRVQTVPLRALAMPQALPAVLARLLAT